MIIGNKTSRLTNNLRFGSPLILIKNATGAYTDGLYVKGADEETEIVGHYQSATEDDRQNLPEGERLREAIKVWIKTDDRDLIRPIRQGSSNSPGDVIRISTLDYEVYSVDNYSNDQHIMAICMRIENQDD